MIIDEADSCDHRTAAGERNGQVPVDPVQHRRDDHPADRGYGYSEAAPARCRSRVGAALVWNVEKLIERVQTHTAREQPAQNRRCREKNQSLNHQLIACEQDVDKSETQVTPKDGQARLTRASLNRFTLSVTLAVLYYVGHSRDCGSTTAARNDCIVRTLSFCLQLFSWH